ncbi:uncharacterized protein LOC120359950 [Solenopsis invicta]|uniref:uncharacterized protein LOC120359950 n=1 Tax=Solenopsis invicta TaxID=13686 RepID=UPI00193CEA71|nr:uncharacterized protein LOC120359950 [Solenopsis invicta]
MAAVDDMKNSSAPGLDQFSYKIIKALPHEFIIVLVNLFNALLQEGRFPKQWSQSLIVLIPKPQGGVRPISLLSCFLKVLEKTLYLRLRWAMENRCSLPDFQAGFRANRSCVDNLVSLSSYVHSAFLEGIDKHGLSPKFCRFIYNLTSEREIFFAVGGELKGPYRVHKGTPQGSILSPSLFNIYLRNIGKHLADNTQILQYADDLAVFVASDNERNAIAALQASIDRISLFLNERGLDLSSEKSQLIVFSRKRTSKFNTNNTLNIIINDNPIPRVDSARFLGVWFDNKLRGNVHLKHLIVKGRKLADIISSLSGVWWGAHPRILLQIYRAIFRSSIEYGGQIFQFQRNSMNFLKLKRLIYRCIRVAYGYRISTPINIMLFESKEPPLEIRVSHISSKYLYKALANKSNPVISFLEALKGVATSRQDRISILKRFPIFGVYVHVIGDGNRIFRSTVIPRFQYNYPVSCFKPKINDSLTKFKKDTPNELIRQSFRCLVEEHFSLHVKLYTDGSKSKQGIRVGASVWIPCLGRSVTHKLPTETSIFTAEAWALLEAVGIIEELHWKNVVIFTDSLSVLRAVMQHSHKADNYVVYLKYKLFVLNEAGVNLTLCWTPAHRGIPGNEAADAAAKEAARCGYAPPFRIPYADFFAMANIDKCNKFKAYLEDAAHRTGAQHAALYQQDSRRHPWFHRKSLSRKEIVIINRLRSNHYNLNYSLHRKNMTNLPSCDCGDGRQDANHIIFYCPTTTPKSCKLRKYIKDKFPFSEINIFPMLKFPTSSICRLILAYFTSCNLLI